MNSILKRSLSLLMILAIALFGLSFVRVNADTVEYALYEGDITAGDYIIVYDGVAMNTTTTSNRLQYTAVTVTAGKITDPSAAIVWHIAQSGDYWTIHNEADNVYAVSKGTKNQATTSSTVDDKALWTITVTGADGNKYEIVNKYNSEKSINANLRRNGTYGFATYATGTGGSLSLYKRVEGGAATGVTVTFKAGGATYDSSFETSYADSSKVTLTMPGVDVFETLPDGGYVTFLGWGQDAAGSVEFAAGASVDFTSSANIYPIFSGKTVSIAEALEICEAVGTESSICQYTFSGIIYQMSGTNTAFITDNASEPSTIQCYAMTLSDAITVGDYITVTGYLTNYKGTTPETKNGATYIKSADKYFLVQFETNGGNAIGDTFVKENEFVTVAAPTKTDFDFVGWYLNSGLTDPFELTTPVTCQLKLYAKWATTFATIKSLFAATKVTAALKFSYVRQYLTAGYTDDLKSVHPVTGTSYQSWDCVTPNGTNYHGNTAGGNSAIQLRSYENSGIVASASSSSAKKVVVSWNENTVAGRTLDVYGKNTVYSQTNDLYNNTKKGTLLGSIVCGESTELVITGDYLYIGVRSNNGAMWLDSLDIEYLGEATFNTFDDLELQFKYDFDFAEAAGLVAESGLYIIAGDSFVYDNDAPISTLPEGKKIVLQNAAFKNSYIGGLEIADMVEYYDKTVTAVAYIRDADGNYYFNTAKSTSVEAMINAYKTLFATGSLECKLATALEAQIYE